MIISLLSQLFTSLSRFYDVSQKSDSKEVVSIANTIAYMENHYNEDLSIEELAQYSDCPPDISAGSFSAYTALVLQNI